MVMLRASGALVLALASTTGGTAALAQAGKAAAAQSGTAAPYRINPGDELEVYVWGEDRLRRVVKVLPDGSFSYPLVGRVEAAGKLPSELEQVITRGLASQFREQVPQVTVSITAPSGFSFSVMGKVRSPGTFAPGKYVNVLEAIGLAGGPSEFAQTNDVVIMRKQGGGLTPIRLRLTDALRGNPSQRDLAGLPVLQAGDTVVVP
jgi:polysaccharide export outer membrane protein